MSDDKAKCKRTAPPQSHAAEPEFKDFLRPADIPLAIGLACQWEVLAAKPGNVHRLADFPDMGLVDFLSSAVVISGVAQQWLTRWTAGGLGGTAPGRSIDPPGRSIDPPAPQFGEFVFDAICATRMVTSTNTNLGIALLLGPMAESFVWWDAECPDAGQPLDERLAAWSHVAGRLIEQAGVDQTRWLYRAIGLANPGGMGQVEQADVHALASLKATDTVAHVMKLAAERDAIAAEYGRGFAHVFNQIVPDLTVFYAAGYGLQWATIATFVRRLARQPDTLIARKAGWAKASEVATWARRLADEYFPDPPDFAAFEGRQEDCELALADLDFALRGDGQRLNPGTTADLIAAGLFVAVMAGMLALPVRW